MLRKILIGFAILLLLLLGAGVYLYHKIQPVLRESKARQKMLRPRLVKGEGNFTRSVFYTSGGLGAISQISVGSPADHEGADIAVVGGQGADFIDVGGRVKKSVRFAVPQKVPVIIARIDAAGQYGYLTRDESWAVPATLFDKEGKVSWRSQDWPGVDDSAPGDVSGDGKLSVAIGFNGGGGLVLVDGQGNEQWKKEEGNVWHVEMLDTNGDGHDEILHSNAKGQLLVRNGNGEVIARYMPDAYVAYFAVTRWEEEARASHILARFSATGESCCKKGLVLLDATGRKITELESPMGDLFTQLTATPVRFEPGADYFAVLEATAGGSMLLLYGEDAQVKYQEIIGDTCIGMSSVPEKDGEHLFVGCTDKIWEYSPAPTKTVPRQNNAKDR